MKRNLFLCTVIILITSLLAGCKAQVSKEPKDLGFKGINAQGLNPQQIPAQNIVFSNDQDWKRFWEKYASTSAPKIDFNKNIVAGVFLGQRPNPGYGVEITSVRKINGEIKIKYTELLPSPKKAYIQVIVFPFNLIYFSKAQGKIVFTETKKIRPY